MRASPTYARFSGPSLGLTDPEVCCSVITKCGRLRYVEKVTLGKRHFGRPQPGKEPVRESLQVQGCSKLGRPVLPNRVHHTPSATCMNHSRTALPIKISHHFKSDLGKVIRGRHSPIEISQYFAIDLGKLTTPKVSVREAPRFRTSMSTDSRRAGSMLEGPEEKGGFKSDLRKKRIS